LLFNLTKILLLGKLCQKYLAAALIHKFGGANVVVVVLLLNEIIEMIASIFVFVFLFHFVAFVCLIISYCCCCVVWFVCN